MQNLNYDSSLISESFVDFNELGRSQRKGRDIDFKLIILLILIVLLGLTLHEYEQQTEIHCSDNTQEQSNSNQNSKKRQKQLLNSSAESELQIEENKKSILLKQLLLPNAGYLKSNPIMKNSINSESEQVNTQTKAQQVPSSQVTSNHQTLNDKNSQTQNPDKPNHQNQVNIHDKIKNHKLLMKKNREFYVWFSLFICCFIVYSCYRKESPDDFIMLRVKNFSKEQCQLLCDQCAICISEFSCDDQLIALPCSQKHAFHSKCIAKWLTLKKNCPICRSDFKKPINN